MKVFVALLLLAASAAWAYGAYGMMGYGMMRGYPGGGPQGFLGYMAEMHNYLYGTNYTEAQAISAFQNGSWEGMMRWYGNASAARYGCPMMDGDGWEAAGTDDDAAPQPSGSPGPDAPPWAGWMMWR
jgi:hypothetical protein